MKKFLTAMGVFLFTFFSIMANPLAKENITYEWGQKLGSSSNDSYFDSLYTYDGYQTKYYARDDTLKTSDGYVTISINNNSLGVMRKVSSDGKNVLWENVRTSGQYLGIVEFGNYYYALGMDDDVKKVAAVTKKIFISKVEKNTGKIVKENSNVFSEVDGGMSNIRGASIRVANNQLYIYPGPLPIDPETLGLSLDPDSVDPSDSQYIESVKKLFSDNLSALGVYAFYDFVKYTEGLEILYGIGEKLVLQNLLTPEEAKNFSNYTINDLYDAGDGTIYAVGDLVSCSGDEIDDSCDVEGYLVQVKVDPEIFTTLEEFITLSLDINANYDKYDEEGTLDAMQNKVERLEMRLMGMLILIEGKWIQKGEMGTRYYDVTGIKDDYIIVTGLTSQKGISGKSTSSQSNIYVYDNTGALIETRDLAADLGVDSVDINHIHANENGEIYGQAFGHTGEEVNSYIYKYSIPKDTPTKEPVVPNTIDRFGRYILIFMSAGILLLSGLYLKKKFIKG